MPVSIEAGADELVARDGDPRIGAHRARANRLHSRRAVLRLGGERLRAHAPYELEDLFALTVRPTKRQITEAIYRAKVERGRRSWPELTILPW